MLDLETLRAPWRTRLRESARSLVGVKLRVRSVTHTERNHSDGMAMQLIWRGYNGLPWRCRWLAVSIAALLAGSLLGAILTDLAGALLGHMSAQSPRTGFMQTGFMQTGLHLEDPKISSERAARWKPVVRGFVDLPVMWAMQFGLPNLMMRDPDANRSYSVGYTGQISASGGITISQCTSSPGEDRSIGFGIAAYALVGFFTWITGLSVLRAVFWPLWMWGWLGL